MPEQRLEAWGGAGTGSADRLSRKSEIRNPKLAKPEPKKPNTESWQKNGGKNMELPKLHPNCARFGKDEAKSETNSKKLEASKRRKPEQTAPEISLQLASNLDYCSAGARGASRCGESRSVTVAGTGRAG
jgi:hypothetical protein